jgi:hypothetical protein
MCRCPRALLWIHQRMVIEMAVPFGVPAVPVLHASEPIDPTLWAWLSDKIDHVLGLSPGMVIAILGTFIVLFPIVVMVMVWRRRGEMGR